MQPGWWKGHRGEWYVVAQFLLIALVLFGPHRWAGWPAERLPHASVRLGLSILLMLAGATLSLSSALRLGANLTPLPHPKERGTLVQNGAYGFVRHPIYAGLLLGAFGWALKQGTIPVFAYAGALFVLFDVKAAREERWLVSVHPGYQDYQRRVRKLIPWLY